MNNNKDIPVFVPLLTINRFALAIGVTPDVVLGWINRGYIKTTKIGKRRLVNITELMQDSEEE